MESSAPRWTTPNPLGHRTVQKTTANDSTIISIISPILIITGGAFFLKEIVTRREKIGISIVCIGTILTIIQPFFETGVVGPKGNLYGNVLVFLGTLAGAGYILLYKSKSFHHLDPFILTGISFFVGLLELVSEFTKVVSLSFRLFGNIFAGEVVLGTVASIFAFFVPLPRTRFWVRGFCFFSLRRGLFFSMRRRVWPRVSTPRRNLRWG